jgi:hypothetical protein
MRIPPLTVAYYGTAVVAGIIGGLQLLAFPVDLIALVGLALAATWIQYRRAGRDSFASTLRWAGLFAVTWLPLAWVFGRFPFGP